jgi:8-oxo-dGTP pyrophosphatase MutT (NUDIX family)
MSARPEKQYTSTVFILSDERPRRVLLLHHKAYDKWQPPGGHRRGHENPLEAAVREVREEAGIDITRFMMPSRYLDDRAVALPLPRYLLEETIDARGDQPAHFHLDMVYVIEVPFQEAVNSEDEAHEIDWFTEPELDNLDMFDNVRITLREIFEEGPQNG